MLDFISDTEHFTMVLDLAVKDKETLWIGTADIKDLYVVQGCLPPIFRTLILLWDTAKGWKLHLGLQTMPSLISDTSSLTMNM